MEVTTRAIAKGLNLCHYFTGKPCKRGHIAPRLVSNFNCVECPGKDVLSAKAREWRRKNRERSRSSSRQNCRNEKAKHPERVKDRALAATKRYQARHPDRIVETRKKGGGRRREYERKRRATNLNARISCNLRTRLYCAVRNNQKTGSAVKDLGCTITELKCHLESQFQPGMSWENWGHGKDKWHIDHILPLSKFDLTDRAQFLRACHYKNLQPLWADDNIRKGAG
jgi:hypothetical protein